MLDVDDGVRRDGNALSSHLNAEPFPLLNRIGEAPQFGRELLTRVAFFNVALRLGILRCHIDPPGARLSGAKYLRMSHKAASARRPEGGW